MHRQFLLALTALITLGGAGALWVLQKASAAPPPAPPVPVERCMNLSGALEAPEEGLWGYRIREADLKRIKAAEFDAVRLPVRWKLTESDTGIQIDADQLARVDKVVRQALAAELTIILNAHHYIELNQDPDTHIPRLNALWKQLAKHFADAPETLIFELINEPHSQMTLDRTDTLNRQLLATIRAEQPTRWVIYGTGHWGALEGLLKSDPPFDPKAIIGFHYYEPFGFTHQGAFFVNPVPPRGISWGTEADRAAIRRDFAKAARFRDAAGMPLLLGEFGVYEEVPLSQRTDWTEYVRTEAEAAGFGWCHWGFATTFKTYDLETEAWIDPLLKALIP